MGRASLRRDEIGAARRALARRPATVSLIAIVLRALTLLVLVQLAGAGALQRPLGHLRPVWIAVVAATELLTYPAYVLVYQSSARLVPHIRLGKTTVARIVLAGFGPLALSGGFGIDKIALQGFGGDETSAQVRVGAMATMELAVLASATWVVVVALLATTTDVSGSLTWPWAIGVPAGIGCAFWATAPARIEKLSQPHGRRSVLLAQILGGVDAVRTMMMRPRRYAGAWAGIAVYWAAEICAFYAALRTVGLHISIERSILAYATGYLASRRSLPLGGAGLTEALLVYSLYALHAPVGPAIAGVLIYRVFNFLIIVIPALIAYRELRPMLARS